MRRFTGRKRPEGKKGGAVVNASLKPSEFANTNLTALSDIPDQRRSSTGPNPRPRAQPVLSILAITGLTDTLSMISSIRHRLVVSATF